MGKTSTRSLGLAYINYYIGLARETRNAKRENLKDAISSFSVSVAGLVLFTYHWKKIQNEKNQEVK